MGFERDRPAADVADIFRWPIREPVTMDEVDVEFYPWARVVQAEIVPIRDSLYSPLPEDPGLLDSIITGEIDGWSPRVAALMVRAEWFLNAAKKVKWPAKSFGPDGKPTTEADRKAEYDGALADYRFVRDELQNMLIRMVDRVRWAQSARKVHADAQ